MERGEPLELRAPRGTSDIFSRQAGLRRYLEETAVELFERYGYHPITTPIFERTELFTRSIGESTDIVQKEMYTFRDKSGRSLTLRPEGTAPVVRAFLEHKLISQPLPIKLYYSGPMFRYERPQAGRSREFWQVGVEAIGSMDPAIDVETVSLMMHYLEILGLRDLELLLNSMGCSGCRPSFVEVLKAYLEEHRANLCIDCKRRVRLNPLRIFDCKKEKCRGLLKEAPLITDYLCADCKAHFAEVQSLLMSIGVEFKLEPSLVRGFDYYTKTAFEVRSPHLGAQNALGGGGRYDGLIEEFGGPPTPAIGFALGVERVIMALHCEGIDLPEDSTLDVFLAVVGRESKPEGFKLLDRLRKLGIAADMNYGDRSLKAQMKLADRMGALYTLFVGSEELRRGMCKIRDMNSGEQVEVAFEKIPQWLKKQIGSRKGKE